MDMLVNAEAELLKTFPDYKATLDTYQSADIDLHNLSSRNEFHKGFRADAQLVPEIIKPIKRGGYMSRSKSEQTTYDLRKKNNMSLRRLDTKTVTVTCFNPDTLTLETDRQLLSKSGSQR